MWEECKDLKEQINQTEDILDELGTRTQAMCSSSGNRGTEVDPKLKIN